MDYLSIDYLIVYAFLGITAIVGSWGAAPKSFREYATANKEFGTGALIMTILATYIGGRTLIGITNNVYHGGLASLIASELQAIIPILIVLYFIAPKIVHFKDAMTTGDLMHNFYGENARIISGILAFVYCSCVCAGQFMWLKFVGGILGIDNAVFTIVGAGILALYTMRGGMKAVTFTDILHFIVTFSVVPLLAYLMLNQVGGIRTLINSLSAEKLQLFSPDALTEVKGTKTITAGIINILFPGFALSFPFIQRMLMAKHRQQSVNVYTGVLAIYVPFILLLGIMGLASLSLHTKTHPYILLSVVENLSPVTKGLAWATLLSVIISTADSFLHTASVAFVHDTVAPLAKRWNMTIDKLSAVRLATLAISTASLALCLTYENIPAFFVLALQPIGVVYTFPLIAGIVGLKTEQRIFYVSTAMALIAYTMPYILAPGEFTSDIATCSGIITSAVGYLATHYYYNGGFVMVHRSEYGQTTTLWQPSWQDAQNAIIDAMPTPNKVARYFQQQISSSNASTTTLAIFIAISYMVPMFMNAVGKPEAYLWLMILRLIGSACCVGLLLQSIWPEKMQPYFSTFYHFTLLYCFPFMTTFLLLLDGGSKEWAINAMFCAALFIALMDYKTALGIAIGGVVLAVATYRVALGPIHLAVDRETIYTMIYGTSIITAIGVLFSRVREWQLKQANRRLVFQEAAIEEDLPKVVAENQERTNAFQQIGIHSLLHTARKLHSIQHKTLARQQQQQEALQQIAKQQQELISAFKNNKMAQEEYLKQQDALQTEWERLIQPEQSTAQLASISQDQNPQAELHALAKTNIAPKANTAPLEQQQQDLQADLLPLVMQLQDLETRGKEHITLNVNKALTVQQWILDIQTRLNPRGIDVPIIINNHTRQPQIAIDDEKINKAIVRAIATLQWRIQDQDQCLTITLEDTTLSYPLPDLGQAYTKQVAAIRIVIATTSSIPTCMESYQPNMGSFGELQLNSTHAIEDYVEERLIKAHYGVRKVQDTSVEYILPADVYEVRPMDMDKAALALGAMPQRANDHFKQVDVDAQEAEKAFLQEVEQKSNADLGVIKLALNLIKWYHGPKSRHSGEPFYLHPLTVARIALEYNQDEATIVGALLHDTVEDTPMLMNHIEGLFGKETAAIVDLVTHLQSIPDSMYKIKLSEEENLELLANTDNKQGLYVKIADRMHNMRTINGHPTIQKRKKVAQETLDFFVPLAQKLGLQKAADEFLQLCQEVQQQKE